MTMSMPYDEPPERLLNAEQIESYRPGGLHPVDIGQTFKADRYKILRKLGHGASSTVWLAEDTEYHRSGHQYVAVKIVGSVVSKASKEAAIHARISVNETASCHIVTLLDHFKHIGPNDEHDCLVFELMGPSVVALFERSIPLQQGRSLSKQMLLAVQALHGEGIVCSDLHPGNMLLCLKHSTPNLFDEDEGVFISTRRKGNPCVPKRIYQDWPLLEFWDRSASVKWKLSDLGAAFPFNDPPGSPSIPVALRAPEVVLGSGFDHKVDIWRFACYLYEIFSGEPLFCLPPFYPQFDDDQLDQSNEDRDLLQKNMTDDDHLLQIIGTLGMLPPAMLEMWPRRTRYLNGELEIIRTDVGKSDKPLRTFLSDRLEQRVANSMSPKMIAKERADLLHVLRSALQYDPRTRPPACDLLKLDWFREIVT